MRTIAGRALLLATPPAHAHACTHISVYARMHGSFVVDTSQFFDTHGLLAAGSAEQSDAELVKEGRFRLVWPGDGSRPPLEVKAGGRRHPRRMFDGVFDRT